MIRNIGIILIFIICSISGFSQSSNSKLEIKGYVKNLQSVYYLKSFPTYTIDNLFHNRINLKWDISNNIRFNAALRNRLFLGDTPRISKDYGKIIDESNQLSFDLSTNFIDQEGILLNSNIDRLYTEIYWGDLEIKLGRQRINWGIAKFWNPHNVFNSYNFIDFDYEEKPGSDAILLNYNTGMLSSVSLATQYSESWEKSIIGGLWKFNIAAYDFQLIAAKYENDLVFGTGFSGAIQSVGIEGEWSVFTPFSDENESETVLSIALGSDYVFSNQLFLSLGYLYTSSGQSKGDLNSILSFELSPKELYAYRHALFASINYPLTPLINLGSSLVYSPITSHPIYYTANVAYSLAQDWDLSLISQIFIQHQESHWELPIFAGFLQLRYNF